MKKLNHLILVLAMLLAISNWAHAQVDLEKTYFGVEYTFQDQTMVNEPGRNTISTPYKEKKALEVARNLISVLGLPDSALQRKWTWKQGWFVVSPKEAFPYVINAEPVVIEVNTGPKKLGEIINSAQPIFKAAENAGLRPYIKPAAERSGMGHIHVGGPSLAKAPGG